MERSGAGRAQDSGRGGTCPAGGESPVSRVGTEGGSDEGQEAGAGPAPSQGFPKGQGCVHCVATMVIFTEVIGGFIFLSSGLFNSAFVILRLSIYRSFIPRLFKFLFWVH